MCILAGQPDETLEFAVRVEPDGARAALAHTGDRGFGIDLDADHDSVEGIQNRLIRKADEVMVASTVFLPGAPRVLRTPDY